MIGLGPVMAAIQLPPACHLTSQRDSREGVLILQKNTIETKAAGNLIPVPCVLSVFLCTAVAGCPTSGPKTSVQCRTG